MFFLFFWFFSGVRTASPATALCEQQSLFFFFFLFPFFLSLFREEEFTKGVCMWRGVVGSGEKRQEGFISARFFFLFFVSSLFLWFVCGVLPAVGIRLCCSRFIIIFLFLLELLSFSSSRRWMMVGLFYFGGCMYTSDRLR